jgi:hypothetical protein
MPDDSVARDIKQGCSTIMRHNPDDGIMPEFVQGGRKEVFATGG